MNRRCSNFHFKFEWGDASLWISKSWKEIQQTTKKNNKTQANGLSLQMCQNSFSGKKKLNSLEIQIREVRDWSYNSYLVYHYILTFVKAMIIPLLVGSALVCWPVMLTFFKNWHIHYSMRYYNHVFMWQNSDPSQNPYNLFEGFVGIRIYSS
jgi:hypothetical protein